MPPAAMRLLASFMICARPRLLAGEEQLAEFLQHRLDLVEGAFGPDTMTASVPSVAPVMPPLTGASTQPILALRELGLRDAAAPPGPSSTVDHRRTFEP